MQQYRSKVGAVYIIAILLTLLSPVVLAFTGQYLVAALLFLIPVFTVSLYFLTSYTITADTLIVRCIVTRRIPISSITGVSPTNSVLSAPALSVMGRLQIDYHNGSSIISPVHTLQFCAALKAINPHIEARLLDM